MLGRIGNGIENLEVGQADIATLARQTGFDLFVLGCGQFHDCILLYSVQAVA